MTSDNALERAVKHRGPRPAASVAVVFLSLHLNGCGNAYEHLDVNQWMPTGKAAGVPKSTDTPPEPQVFRVSKLDSGRGREVRAGSAVEVRVVAVSGNLLPTNSETRTTEARAWLWMGDLSHGIGLVALGPDVLRASLADLREGGRISVFVDPARVLFQLPTRGFTLHSAYRPDWRQWIAAGDAAASADPDSFKFHTKGEYEVEVVRVCDGRLFSRQGTLKQWGYVFNWGDMNYQFSRQGELEWFAMEIECEAPSARMRFEKGPAYGRRAEGQLLRWQRSYEVAARAQ